MSSLDSRAKVELIRRLEEMEAHLLRLGNSIAQELALPAWIEGCGNGMTARKSCADFICKMDYTDDLEPGGTARLQGLIGSGEHTLQLVAEVNEVKKNLHEFLMCLDCGVLEGPRGQPTFRNWTADLLAQIGRARFNRRQAVRSFVILERRPVSASFFWGRTRKIRRLTREEAQKLMEKRLAESVDRDPALRYQYEALLNLPEDEPLAQVQDLKEYPRVNLVFMREHELFRKQVMAASPLFYPADETTRPPEIIPLPDQDKKRQRLRRSDLAIELRPYLPAIRVHRYLERARRRLREAAE